MAMQKLELEAIRSDQNVYTSKTEIAEENSKTTNFLERKFHF